jgi:hypothetical protein
MVMFPPRIVFFAVTLRSRSIVGKTPERLRYLTVVRFSGFAVP